MAKTYFLWDHGRSYSSTVPAGVAPIPANVNRRTVEKLATENRVYILRVRQDGRLEMEELGPGDETA